ncbi:hypothetical protein [Streptomyces gardneri]|uniref:Uncharacterized protein n=1 Tax=Streptomyces gardneri TaxID=66892 RepID=A0A4Y3RI48_9ACTN|nr:hypothetical protein [Streptomyces gardneri]GEB57426.1 hypothetical protein SGA01_30310 [Streptomyces gardneri]GHH12695.1 hypothetical protein GCM10017674_58920 [Streptomyces gardneri]
MKKRTRKCRKPAGVKVPAVVVEPGQIEGETRAVDLVAAYVRGDVEQIAACGLQGDELARAHMWQMLNGMLSDAVLADPDFDMRRRAVMPPAGVAWPATPMSEDVAALVWGLAGDGGAGPWLRMSAEDRATAYAISVAARGIAVWGPDRLLTHLARTRTAVSRP